MNRLFDLKPKWLLILYIVVDLFCTGLGMGVPVFCILLGFPVGWFLAKKLRKEPESFDVVLKRIFDYALLSVVVTFGIMVIIWGRCILMLFDSAADYKNFGIPLILYDPLLSFAGWLVLMIFISPFLQLLTTTFGAYITLMADKNKLPKQKSIDE